MPKPTEIFTTDTTQNGLTLMRIIAGEIRNRGYETTEPQVVYEPNWGESQLKIEVKEGGS